MAFSLGGGSSSNRSSMNENVWGPQGQALQDMYGRIGGLFDQSQQGLGQMQGQANALAPFMQQIMQGGMGGYEGLLSGGSIGDTSDIRSELMNRIKGQEGSNMGRMYQSIVGGQGNEYIDPMVDAMKQSGMENLDRMQAGTGMDATAMGQTGSSRHAMENAMQSRDMNRDMMDREQYMRGGAYDKDLDMKMNIARMADTNEGQAQDRLLTMMGQSDQNVGAGMGFGQGMQNLGMGSMAPSYQSQMMPWNMMGQYSNMMGAPTVLGSASSKGGSKNFGMGF